MPAARWLRGVAGCALVLLLWGTVTGAGSGDAAPPAVRIEAGSRAGSQVVALGRDLVIEGRAAAGAAVVGGSARIDGEVGGDLVVVGGDAHLGPASRVTGDVFVLGGKIDTARSATVSGRSVAYAAVPGTLLVLAEGPALGLPAWSPEIVAIKLALLAAWLAALLVLAAAAPGALRRTAAEAAEAPFRSFVIGLVTTLALILTAIFLSALLGPLAGGPLLALVVLGALVLKLWGMVAVFSSLGETLFRRLGSGRAGELERGVVGLLVLGGVKILPWLGTWAWTAATLVGVGATLQSMLPPPGSRS